MQTHSLTDNNIQQLHKSNWCLLFGTETKSAIVCVSQVNWLGLIWSSPSSWECWPPRTEGRQLQLPKQYSLLEQDVRVNPHRVRDHHAKHLVTFIMDHYGIASKTKNIVEHITSYFNHQILETLTDDLKSTGLMGLMRKPHEMALLKAQGMQLQIKRITNETMVFKRGLTRANVQQLTYGDCIKWSKALQVSTKKNKPEMVAELKNLFDGRPANHHINP